MNAFHSDRSVWDILSGIWFNVNPIIEFMDSLNPSFTEVSNVNELLSSTSLSGVGGPIATELSWGGIDLINQHWIIMKSFTDSIHYECDELIDIPFTQLVKEPHQEAYTLNPKDFATTKRVGAFEANTTLAQLMHAVVRDEALAMDFAERSKSLDDDSVPKNLKETLEVAQFWQRQYEMAGEVRELEEGFLEENKSRWDSMTSDERKAALGGFIQDVGNVLGQDTADTLLWEQEDPNYQNNSAYGYVYSYDSGDTTVYMDETYGTRSDGVYDIRMALNVAVHESRHQYQGVASQNPNAYNAPILAVGQWEWDRQGTEYWTQPIESDARAFAALSAV